MCYGVLFYLACVLACSRILGLATPRRSRDLTNEYVLATAPETFDGALISELFLNACHLLTFAMTMLPTTLILTENEDASSRGPDETQFIITTEDGSEISLTQEEAHHLLTGTFPGYY